MLPNVLEQITLADLESLVTEQVQEGKTVEYKNGMYQFNAAKQEAKVKQHQEFLKDVSSFANSVGGDLIIGVDEHDGVAKAVVGVDVADPDKEKLRMIQLLESWLEPRVGCAIHSVAVANGKFAFVIRIPQSILSPHRVVYANEFGQFWARNSAGAFAMDSIQLRQAFTLTETHYDRINRFRQDRVQAIQSGRTPVLMPNGPKMIFHLIPLESFAGRIAFTPDELSTAFSRVRTLASPTGSSERINMDGIVRTEQWDSEVPASGCVQAFRNGIVEVVADDIIFNIPNDPTNTRFYRTHHENYLKERLREYLNAQKTLGIPLPLWGFLTLAGMKGVRIKLARDHTPKPPIDRDVLWLPEIQIADYAVDPLSTLRPLFDMIWNAGGYPKCLDFDNKGEFVNVT